MNILKQTQKTAQILCSRIGDKIKEAMRPKSVWGSDVTVLRSSDGPSQQQ
jgi:hypothetical protein